MFDLGGGRQDDVGMACRVCQELLDDNGIEVLTPEAVKHELLIRCGRGRIRVVHDQCADRRIGGFELTGERATESHHVDGPRRGVLELRQRDRLERLVEELPGPGVKASAHVAPRADECRQARDPRWIVAPWA